MAIDDVFPVLADSTRRALLEALRSGDRSVGELVDALGVSQPTVSKHLKVLREAGLVSMRAEGQRRFYSVTPQPLAEAGEWLAGFLPRAGSGQDATSHLRPAVPRADAAKPADVHAAPALPAAIAPAGAIAPAADTREAQAAPASQQLGRTVGRRVEQVTGKAQDLLERLPKPKFGRRR